MTKLDKLSEFFKVLRDGKWHNIDEIVNAINIEHERLIKIIKLFAKIDIIHFDKERSSVKINEKWSFLAKEN